MTSLYTPTNVTGYNASPPSDDGSQTAANQVTWAKVKALADPLNTAIASMDSQLQTAFASTYLPDSTGASVANVWTTPAFSAGNFTGNASMTWTVDSGDVTTYEYTIDNKKMTVNFLIVTSTIAGTPSTTLQIAIPASKVATHTVSTAGFVVDNGGSQETAIVSVVAGASVISISRLAGTSFSASTNNAQARGSITFQIN